MIQRAQPAGNLDSPPYLDTGAAEPIPDHGVGTGVKIKAGAQREAMQLDAAPERLWQAAEASAALYELFGNGAACCANCDSSTAPLVLNVADPACFLNAFAAHGP
jgi:hypothetical protein